MDAPHGEPGREKRRAKWGHRYTAWMGKAVLKALGSDQAGFWVDPRERLAVALDLPSADEALRMVDELGDRCRWLKVGMELFYAAGASLVHELRQRRYSIFLDLKIHDIPNTAASAVRSLCSLDVQILSLHASGGPIMIREALAAAGEIPSAPVLAGVTVLTSMNEAQLQAVDGTEPASARVLRLAHMGYDNGLRVFVASPEELTLLRGQLGREPYLIVPGIRPAGSNRDDQSRTATPRDAITRGASLLVVGRPITRAGNRRGATEAILEEIAAAL